MLPIITDAVLIVKNIKHEEFNKQKRSIIQMTDLFITATRKVLQRRVLLRSLFVDSNAPCSK